jgi:hypothetical protein
MREDRSENLDIRFKNFGEFDRFTSFEISYVITISLDSDQPLIFAVLLDDLHTDGYAAVRVVIMT